MPKSHSLRLLVLVGLLAGCIGPHSGGSVYQQPADLTEQDVVGTWQNQPRGALLIFETDGAFAATDLPHEIFERFVNIDLLPPEFDPENDKLPGSGIWSLRTPLGASDGPRSTVQLTIELLAGRQVPKGRTSLRAERVDGTTFLTFYIGDPDSGNVEPYVKCEATCPSSS